MAVGVEVLALGMIFALTSASLGWAASLCDLKGCSCHSGGPGTLACDCHNSDIQELTLQSTGQGRIPETLSSVSVTNCDIVHVYPNAFSLAKGLRTVNLKNIKNLDIDEDAFSWNHVAEENRHPGITVNINNSTLEEIPSHAFNGMIHTVTLRNTTVENLRVFSFATLTNTDRIEFTDTIVKNVESQAFKKFSLNSFIITGGTLPILPTRAVVDVEVTNELRFENVQMDILRSSSIKAYGMEVFRLINCKISRLEKECFKIDTMGSVIIHNNVIKEVMTESIHGISVTNRHLLEKQKQDFSFMNNSIENFEPRALTFNTSDFKPRLEQVKIQKQCTCTESKFWITQLVIILNSQGSTPVPYENALYCKQLKDFVLIKEFQKSQCSGTEYKKYAAILFTTSLIVLAFVTTVVCLLKNRVKQYFYVPTEPDQKVTFKNKKNLTMVVPEGKTYRETELHVITEQAEPIVEYNPSHLLNSSEGKSPHSARSFQNSIYT